MHSDTGQSALDGSIPSDHEVLDNPTFSDKQKPKGPHDEGRDEVETDDTMQRPRGRKMAFCVRAEEDLQLKSLQNAMEIASSLTRRNELAEKRISMLPFRKEECETQEDLKD